MSCQVDGDPNAPICIIGMAPGREELDADRPFVGGAGRLLWAIAKAAGFSRADCYIINVIGEWPGKKTGDPTAEQLTRYRARFEGALSVSTAKILVPLGGVALRALGGFEDGIEAWRGYLVKPNECPKVDLTIEEVGEYKTNTKAHRKGDPKITKRRVARATAIPESVVWILPTLHPAGVLRSGKKTLPAFKADLDRAMRALRGTLNPRHSFELELTDSPDGAGPIDSGPVVLDVETMPNNDIFRIGVAGSRCAWTAPWSGRARQVVGTALSAPDAIFVAHNVQFDLQRLAEAGLAFDGPLYDTMLAAQLLQPDLYKGLNEVASLYLDRRRWKHLAAESPAYYNLEDAKTEFELYEITRQLLAADGMLDLFENSVMKGVRVFSRMTQRGVPLHPERRVVWLNTLTEKEKELYGTWQALVGNVNPASPLQVKDILYKRFKLPLKLNKRGDETAEKAALIDLQREVEPGSVESRVIQTLLDIRATSKLLRTYARRPVGDDGCVHPYYLPISKDSDSEDTGRGMAGTGRPQARNPNIQQLPPDARRIVVPHSSDMVLVSFDFRQLELRIAAELSGDKSLRDDIEAGIFERIMVQFGCDRTRAKNLVYGTLYGGGPRALQRALKSRGIITSERECRELQDKFSAAYPDLWLWRQRIVSTMLAQWYLTNPYGRRRYFYGGNSDAPAAINFIPQSTAADIVWSDLEPFDANATVYGASLLASVHDEWLTECPRASVSEFVPAALGVLERVRPLIGPKFRALVGVKIGEDWGSMNPYEQAEEAKEAAEAKA